MGETARSEEVAAGAAREAAAAPADDARRGFLGRMAAGLGGLIGLLLAAPPLAAFLGAWRRPSVRSAEAWVEAGRIDDLAAGRPVRAQVLGTLRDGWMRHDGVPLGSVWLVRDEAGSVTALSNVCPHLGCGVDLVDGDRFHCPCHDSVFTLEGRLVSGPARGGLPVVPSRIEDGRVLVDAHALEGEDGAAG